MYLSILIIEVGKHPDRPRPGRIWLRNRYRVHQRLCMAFPSNSRLDKDPVFTKPFEPNDFAQGHVHVRRNPKMGFLFRIDPRAGANPVMVVQSAIEPDWDYAFHNAEYLLAAPPVVVPYGPELKKGRELSFRLEANATKKVGTELKSEREASKKGRLPSRSGRHGRRVPVPYDQLVHWLERKGQRCGFDVDPDELRLQVGYAYVKKPASVRGQRLFSVRYEGRIGVTDPDLLRKALGMGIGPAKAFGFGLMSLSDA